MHRNKPVPEPSSEVIEIITRTDDKDLLQKFFSEIFTEAELKDLSLRWELMKRLREGIPQRQIASELGISLCKITRGAKILKDPTSATNKLFSQFFT
ncbi:MAG: Trp family transcriptional regulator [Chitinispirillaceae bacterium]